MDAAANTMSSTDFEVSEVYASGNNFLTEHDFEASAQILLKFTGGETASFTYCGTRVPGQYDTYFYFTDGVAYVEDGGSKLHIKVKGAEPEIYEFKDDDIFRDQITELEKLLSGEENAIVTAERGREIFDVLERIIKCIHG